MESAFGRAAMMYGIMIVISFFVAVLISLMTRILTFLKKEKSADATHPIANGNAQ